MNRGTFRDIAPVSGSNRLIESITSSKSSTRTALTLGFRGEDVDDITAHAIGTLCQINSLRVYCISARRRRSLRWSMRSPRTR